MVIFVVYVALIKNHIGTFAFYLCVCVHAHVHVCSGKSSSRSIDDKKNMATIEPLYD